MIEEPESFSKTSFEERQVGRIQSPVVLALLGLLAGGGLFFVGYMALRDRTPPLAAAALEAGRRQWEKAAIASYDLTLTVAIDREAPKDYQLSVRGGKVASFQINGVAHAENPSYSVPGLFDILEREIEMAGGKGARAAGAPQNAVLRAEFDPRYGYPKVFKRLAPGQQSCFIEVKRFAAAEAKER